MNFRIRYFHDDNGCLTKTIATTPVGDNMFAVAFAECSKKDSPTRAMGRKIASGRLQAFMHGRVMTKNIQIMSHAELIDYVNEHK